ncbi:GntP family permease [Nonlabens xiamenensis]|uniref:GntP family permease n=1 Tax=Nonlabens xiamenensis TaxID=2341043 RepID=UPI000F60550B|nr:gluconate:H+ symporter [Nonlabens xiamenensis]
MIDYSLLLAIVLGIAVLLFLILRCKLQAFIALLISSIIVGIASGMHPMDLISAIQQGMASTLGFVAVVVGLGAMFGAMLEHSGGAEALAQFLLKLFGEKRASWAVMITGFVVAIPVFFDVAFIILVPVIYSLQRKSGKSLLLYAIPLLAGLAITHSFIPPTPGPVAVADILKADLGWVIVFGFAVGVPTAIVCGPLFGKYIGSRLDIKAPGFTETASKVRENQPSVGLILAIIGFPILLIVMNTLSTYVFVDSSGDRNELISWIKFVGHPFTALILANLLAWYFLGIQRKVELKKLMDISTFSMEKAGIIILLTGAGGVFKQVLIDTGAGVMMADAFAKADWGMLLLGYATAVIVRLLQGSATVAMITAAGILASVLYPDSGGSLDTLQVSAPELALLVIAIASGASIFSHVNDSGFWLVGKYLGLNEAQTLKSWSVMTTLLSISGFASVCLLSLFL